LDRTLNPTPTANIDPFARKPEPKSDRGQIAIGNDLPSSEDIERQAETRLGRSKVPGLHPDVVDPSKLVTGTPGAENAGGSQAAGTAPTMGAGGAAHTAWAPAARPQDIAALKASQAGVVATQADVTAADADAADREREGHEKRWGELAANEGDQVERAKAFDAHVADMLDKRNALAAEAKTYGESYGLHPTAATRVRYTIASFLGALGTGLNHGMPNVAADNIRRAQDLELDRQKQVLESKKGAIADQDSLLAAAYRRYGNMDQAMTAARQIATQKSVEELNAMAAASKNAQVIAGGKAATARLMEGFAQDDLKLYHPVTVGGAGGADQKAELEAFHKHVAEEVGKPGGKALTWNEFDRNWRHGGGASQATKPGGNAKPNADAETLETLANEKGIHGQDWYDRNAPRFLRSDESLRNEAALRGLGNAVNKAEGGRAAPATVPTSDVIEATYGRATDENVRAVQKRAGRISKARKGGSPERDLERDEE
jgi:hypothetical protein